MLCIGKRGWPVELVKGHPIKSFIRKLIHTRSFYRGTIVDWNRERHEAVVKQMQLNVDANKKRSKSMQHKV